MGIHRKRLLSAGLLAGLGLMAGQLHAEDALAGVTVGVDTLWVLLAGCLVFFMNAGFGLVEAGFCRAKNTVNILSKNFVVFALASLGFYLLGWGIMFGDGNGFMGTSGLSMLGGADNSPATGDAYQGVYGSINWTGIPLFAKFFFQLVFAGTAATIVSGAVAERIKYGSFIVFAFFLVAVMYPITGHWVWGGGWLSSMETAFSDFAGSTVVHSVGGWAALAGVLVLGPRKGKYLPGGQIKPIPPHSFMAGFTGCMILWLGWFGFNPGSQMAIAGEANYNAVAGIFLTTNSSAIMGILGATALSWIWDGKPDLGMSINGCLAGLVAITAPCAAVSVNSAMIIGLLAGMIVVASIKFLDKVRIDDPVGAISVHGVNGAFGTLALGLFATKGGLFMGGGLAQTIAQIKGIVAVFIFTFLVSLVAWLAIKALLGVRVGEAEEEEGLDIGEHGEMAYGGFRMGAE